MHFAATVNYCDELRNNKKYNNGKIGIEIFEFISFAPLDGVE